LGLAPKRRRFHEIAITAPQQTGPAWIDPSRDISGVILMQVLPFGDRKCLEAFAGFESGVYTELDAAQRAA
jgi:hypothetical protein